VRAFQKVAATPNIDILIHTLKKKGFALVRFSGRFDFVLCHDIPYKPLMDAAALSGMSSASCERLIFIFVTMLIKRHRSAEGEHFIKAHLMVLHVDCYCPLTGTVNKLIVYKL
jgi:hypothetical protein